MNLLLIPSLLAGLLGMGLAIFVFLRNRTHPANLSFGAGMTFLSFSALAELWGLMHPTASRLAFSTSLSGLMEGVAVTAWIVFSLTYARINYQSFLNRWSWWIAAFACTLAMMWIWGYTTGGLIRFPEAMPDFPARSVSLGLEGKLFRMTLLAGAVAVLFNLENTYRNAFWVRRWKIKYVLLGAGGIWAFSVYQLGQSILYSGVDVSAMVSKSLVMALCFIVLFFAVVLQRQLDSDIFVSRYVVYQSVTMVMVGVYLVAVALISNAVDHFGGTMGRVFAVMLVFCALLVFTATALSENLRRQAKVFISKHFYKYKYDYRVQWLELTERLGSKFTEKEVAGELATVISNALSIGRVIVWVRDDAVEKYRPAYSMPAGVTVEVDGASRVVKALGNRDYVINLSEKSTDKETEEVWEEGKEWLEHLRVSAIVPLHAGDTLLGFFAVGENMVSNAYDYEDYDLLKTVARQAANTLLTIRLTRDLMKGRELETFHKLSSFLLHDLKNSVSMLNLVSANAAENMSNPEFQQDALRAVRATVEKMNNLISKLSSFPKGMGFTAKAVSVDRLVSQTVAQTSAFLTKGVELETELKGHLTVMGDEENLCRVLTNLMLNAVEAMNNKGKLSVRVYPKDKWAVLSVRDTGCGMSQEFMDNSLFELFQSTKKRGIGIGLYQCKFIVDAHKGWIEVDSAVGAGTEFRIVLPLHER